MSDIYELARQAKASTQVLRTLSAETKNKALAALAEEIMSLAAHLQTENQKDIDAARENGLTAAMIDRLTLSDKVLVSMSQGLQEVIELPDPVGEVIGSQHRPNGLQVARVRIPIGVIGFIYESRPNVTVDAAGLCLKSGNAVILKGGKEAFHSNRALVDLIAKVLEDHDIPSAAVQMVPTTDRDATTEMLTLDEQIDLIIPRGGEGLIRFVAENSRIPVLKHYKGVCHVYVDESADIDMAVRISANAKAQRPGVCNAMETLLVHEKIADEFLPKVASTLEELGVEIRGCPDTLKRLPGRTEAREEDWPAEYLDLILAVKVVRSMREALDHIACYGSNHTEAIVTSDEERARFFLAEVDSSLVLVNASTRFNDGNQLGLGAEIGISTSKLHAFGPMGLNELTTTKFIAYGNGQIRT